MARRMQLKRPSKRRAKAKVRGKKKDPILVDGKRPRPMYVDYKDLDLLKKLNEEKDYTIIVVTHDLRIKKYAKRIINLMDGRVAKR